MNRWFWLAVITDGKLRWPKWLKALALVAVVICLLVGVLYAVIVFNAVRNTPETHHVQHRSSH